jgi:hypothetical protein
MKTDTLWGAAPITKEHEVIADKIVVVMNGNMDASSKRHYVLCLLADFQDELEVRHGIHPKRIIPSTAYTQAFSVKP